MFLRIGELVRSANFARFVDVDREPASNPFAADLKAIHLRTAPRLALPGRGSTPVGLGICGVALDVLDQGKQVVTLMPLTTVGSAIFCWATMMGLLCLGAFNTLGYWSVASAA